MKFELERLLSPKPAEILAEINRVAELYGSDVLTRKAFDQHAKISSSAVVRKFGGWEAALKQAGLDKRYSGRTVSSRMRTQAAKSLTDDQLILELQSVAKKIGIRTLTMTQFNAHAAINSAAIVNRLGSWKAALEKAGLTLSPLGRRWSDDDYFENLLKVWTSHGRQPKYAEMDQPPSTITSGAYEAKWGSWKKALLTFLERVNTTATEDPVRTEPQGISVEPLDQYEQVPDAERLRIRKVPLGLRYNVLRRDRFKCVLCGASPANDPQCQLHVDHTVAFSEGGETTLANLRTLCHYCNLGKGNRREATDVI